MANGDNNFLSDTERLLKFCRKDKEYHEGLQKLIKIYLEKDDILRLDTND